MSKELSKHKLNTGEHQQGLPENSVVFSNAEVEGDEYIRYPDGITVRAAGDPHSKGGVDVHIPDGTKILSARVKVDSKTAKSLSKDLGMKVSTKDSYSKVMDMYVKKIGLKKLYEEQEDLSKEMEKVLDPTKDIDQDTKAINKQYVSERIFAVEKKKEPKEQIKTAMFDRLFLAQENGKPSADEMSDEEVFAKGGIKKCQFDDMIKKHNLTKKQGRHLILTGDLLPKYPHGGEHGEPKTSIEVDDMLKAGDITEYDAALLKANIIQNAGGPRTSEEVELLLETGNIGNEEAVELRAGINISKGASSPNGIKFTTSTGRHAFSHEDEFKREKQARGSGAFGNITKDNIPQVLSQLYKNFPDIVADDKVFNVSFDEDGNIDYNKDLDFSKQLDQVKEFQKRADERMRNTAKVITSNPDSFSEEEIHAAEDFVKNQTFDDSLARGLDSKLGQFTSGRYNLGVDVVSPKELEDLQARGIYTVNQLNDAVTGGDVKLSEPSLERFNKIKGLQVEGSDFSLNPIEDGEPAPAAPDAAPAAVDPAPESAPILDDINLPGKKGAKHFAEPDQMPLPPSPLAAHLKTSIDLQRIDPVRVGIENIKQQADEGLKTATEQLAHLPPNQRAAAIASMQSGYQKNINDAIHKANVTNANNLSRAELFNIGQAGREQQSEANSQLDFERRQLTAKAKTEEEFRRYFDEVRRIGVNSFRNQQELNLLNQMTPDFDLNSAGNQVEYNPNSEFKLDNGLDPEIAKYL